MTRRQLRLILTGILVVASCAVGGFFAYQLINPAPVKYDAQHASADTGLKAQTVWHQIDAVEKDGECRVRPAQIDESVYPRTNPNPIRLVLPIPPGVRTCQFGVKLLTPVAPGGPTPQLGTSHYFNFGDKNGITYNGPAETIIVGLVPGTYEVTMGNKPTGFKLVINDPLNPTRGA